MWSTDVYEAGSLPPGLAAIIAGGVLVLLASAVAVCARRAARRTALARAAERSVGDHPALLVEGADVVLSGVVRHFEDRQVAVKISVHQTGTEAESSGSWSHAWTEIDREIVLAPFLLEIAKGQHVLVHPPKNVDVADALDQKVWIDRNHRVLSAELVPGERIFARGRLERSDRATANAGGAYRDVAWGWALHPARGQMLLSSEPLGHGLRQRAAFHRAHAWGALGLLIVTQLLLVGYYARLAGHTEVATAGVLGEYQTEDNDGHATTHFTATVRGRTVDIDGGDYLRLGSGSQVPVRVGMSKDWELGSAATFGWPRGGLLSVLAIAFWVVYAGRRTSSRPWFRKELSESGAGRLPDPPP